MYTLARVTKINNFKHQQWPSNSLLKENMCLHVNIYRSIIHHSQRVGTTQMCNVVCPHSEILFDNKNEWSSNMWQTIEKLQQSCYVKAASQKRPPHVVWFHIFKIPTIGKSIDTESRQVVAKGWKWRDGEWLLNGQQGFFSFCRGQKYSKPRLWWWLHNLVNTLKHLNCTPEMGSLYVKWIISQ